MSKENFSWKSLFVNDNATPNSTPSQTTDYPKSTSTQFPAGVNSNPMTNLEANPFVDEVWDVYEKGFASLNSSEFDFFELYKSVMVVGVNNQQSYVMAYTMGKALKPDLSKQFLLDKAKYYSDEIEKVYTKYDTIGLAKRKDLTDSIAKEKDAMTRNIQDLESRIAQLQAELAKSKADFEIIDHANKDKFNEIQLKMEANNIARQKITTSINQVVSGINQYL